MKKTIKAKIQQEFNDVSLGDKRLDKRLKQTVGLLNTSPTLCINAVIEDWKTKKAAYRLFDNKKVSPEKILAPHFKQTQKRMDDWEYVYSIQDTSFLEFNKHNSTKGLGSIGRYADNDHIQGLVMHLSLAVSSTGLPLELQSFETWARPSEGYDKKILREKKKAING